MKIEHLALNVADPVGMADWYVEHLGLRIARRTGPPVNCRFLADDSGQSLIEIYHNAAAPVPNSAATPPAVLHLAMVSSDVKADFDRLVAAGATVVDEPSVSEAGDDLAMLRDPWGLALQLVARAESML